MEYFVYIIYSPEYDRYYKGYSSHPGFRIKQHNKGLSRYTKNYRPWRLVYLEVYSSKREAIIRERGLKKYSKAQIKDLIQNCHPNRVRPTNLPGLN